MVFINYLVKCTKILAKCTGFAYNTLFRLAIFAINNLLYFLLWMPRRQN